MAGLGLGSELGARHADRLGRPIRTYALAEAVVALSALLFIPFAGWLSTHAAPPAPWSVAVAFAAVLVPATAMGTTLPLFVAGLVGDRAELARGLGRLYSVNLLGGVLGALLTGVILLPRFGLRSALLVLGAAGLAVALVALAVAPRPRPTVVSGADEYRTCELGRSRWVVVLAAAVGALSFCLQVCYGRVFSLLFGSAAYTFSAVVATVLCALGVGGAMAARPVPASAFWGVVSRRLLALAVWTYIGTLAVRTTPQLSAMAARSAPSLAGLRLTVLSVVVGLPMLQVGALFPLLASRFSPALVGRAAGRALLATTLGNLGGAIATAFVLLPMLGLHRVLLATAARALVLGCAVARLAGPGRFAGTASATLLALLFALLAGGAWDDVALSAGAFRVGAYRRAALARVSPAAPCGPERAITHTEPLFHADGATATVVVLGHAAAADCSLYSLRVDGKTEGSVYVRAPLGRQVPADAPFVADGDLPTQVLTGSLPVLIGPSRANAFLVGWGTGMTARAMLDAGIGRVVAAELEPAVLEAARLFDPSALTDPRVELRVGDARTQLGHAPPRSFDVIVSQPSNPWVTGAARLFSREFFGLMHSRLRDGGRALVWVQLYEIDRATVQSLVATFLAVFPAAYASRPTPAARDLLLVGWRAPPPGLFGDTPPSWPRLLLQAGYADDRALHATLVADPIRLGEFSRGAPIATDDNGRIEFAVADALLRGQSEPVSSLLAGL
jgi:predicted membrane-bound spermidine synthase